MRFLTEWREYSSHFLDDRDRVGVTSSSSFSSSSSSYKTTKKGYPTSKEIVFFGSKYYEKGSFDLNEVPLT
jgi:hypothetical protein